MPLSKRIEGFLCFKGKQRSDVQIAFYGGNFLGLMPKQIQSLLDEVQPFIRSGVVDSIRFSTRPDTVTDDRLYLLDEYPVKTIELGVQSMDNTILRLVKRGHTMEDTGNAVNLLRFRGYEVGLQVMVGLPGEDTASSILTGNRVADLHPDFVRIYPTVVLKGSPLANWYIEGRYIPLSLRDAVRRVKKCYQLLKKNDIPVIRMGLQATEDLDADSTVLAGPYHPAFGDLVYTELFFDMASELLKKVRRLPEVVRFKVHPRSVSKMHGQKNQNIRRLKATFGIASVKLITDASLSEDTVMLV
jgi:histone acetyltransferase (RNA polymerase elongator complex component)